MGDEGQADQVDTDPLFQSLTRPPLLFGVPVEYFGMNFMLFGIGFILFLSLPGKLIFAACINLPVHAFGIFMTEKDPNWISVIKTAAAKCPSVQNKGYWKSNSYMP